MHIHVARFRIAHHTGPTDARRGNIGLKDIEQILPNQFPRLCVHTNDLFAGVDLFDRIVDVVRRATIQIQAAVHHNGCRAAADVGRPKHVFTFLAFQHPSLDQILLARNPVLLGSAPMRPILATDNAAQAPQNQSEC